MSEGSPADPPQDDPLLEKIEKAAALAASEVVDEAIEPPQLIAEEAYLDNRLKQLKVQEYEDNLKARRKYAAWTVKLMGLWLLAVLLTVWLAAAEVAVSPGWPGWMPLITAFDVSDSVLIALITTTTANILGLLVIIFNYLFPKKGSGD